MEPAYLTQGLNILAWEKTEIFYSPFYSIIVAALFSLFKSLFIASSVIYVTSAVLTSYFVYKFIKLTCEQEVANIALVLLWFFPILAVSVTGYSHSVVAATSFLFGFLYYVNYFYNTSKNKYILITTVFALASIFTRPETLIAIILVVIYVVFKMMVQKRQNNAYALILIFMIGMASGLFFHKEIVKSISTEQDTLGVFGNNSYSYLTFIHTYSLRYANIVDNDLALKYSQIHIGTPNSNNFSIFKAISKNYPQFYSNLIYQIKSTFELFGKPVLIPFYFYIFIGAVFLAKRKASKIDGPFAFLLLIIIGNILPAILFHPEARYLLPSAISLLILSSMGMSALNNKQKKLSIFIVSVITFLIYIRYVIVFRDLGLARCG
jgi:hypothetical protein